MLNDASPRRWVRWTGWGVAIALLATACTTGSGSSTSTAAAGDRPVVAPPPPPARIAPVLRRPGPPGDALAGVPTLLGGLVLAESPIVRVELWSGPDLVEAVEYDEPRTELRLGWDWTPPGAGLYGLVLRATDDSGAVATSFPLWVRAVEPAGPPIEEASGQPRLMNVLAPLGRNRLAGVQPSPAPAISVDSETCLATVTLPAVQGAGGVAVYAATFGSTGFVPVALLPAAGGEAQLAVGAAPVIVYSEAFDATAASPGPPALVYPPNPCASQGWAGDLVFHNGILANPKGADRAYLYVSLDGGEDWERVPGADQTFVYPGPDGGFDFGGLPAGSGAGATALFEAWGWVGGTLTPLGRGSWSEPEPSPGGGGVAGLAIGEYAVGGPYTGPLVLTSNLDWLAGKDPASGFLTRQGTICTYQPTAPVTTTTSTVPVSVVGGTPTPSVTTAASSPGLATYPASCVNVFPKQYPSKFRWEPLGGAMTHGVLQVSKKPIPEGPLLAFPGLVYTQQVDAPTGDYVEFEVPLKEILHPPVQNATLPDWEQVDFQMVENLAGLGGGGNSYSFVPPQVLADAASPIFYLRVVPMQGTTPMVGESNQVVVDVQDTAPPAAPPAPAQPPAMSVEVRMTPPHLPNGRYERCVRVVENPFMLFGTGLNPAPSQTPQWYLERGQQVPAASSFDKFYAWAQSEAFVYQNGVKVNKGLVPGATVCAVQLDPPSKDAWDYIVDAVNFIGYVWDMYVSVWEMMKSWVADVLAYASGCVSVAQATGKSKEEAEKLCSGLAKSAMTYALMAYGVPPTMPKFKDLAEMGKGKLTGVVVKFVADQGILDCGVFQAGCEKLANDLIDSLLDEMQVAATQAATQAAVSGSQWVLSIHPGIYVVPEPAGTLSPAIFEIKVTRSSTFGAPPPPASCTWSGSVLGTKSQYEWYDYVAKTTKTGPVQGWVMKQGSVTMKLSDLKPGQSRSVTLVLDRILDWYPEGQDPNGLKASTYYIYVKPQTWIFFVAYSKNAAQTDTRLITGIGGGPECGSASQTHQQDNAGTEPWEIPS
jgi:hypothetical protein